MSSGDNQELKDCLFPGVLSFEEMGPRKKDLSKLLRATGNAGSLCLAVLCHSGICI